MPGRDGTDQERTRRPIERPLRLASGLLLFTFVTSHFLSHAAGLLLLPGMEQARLIVLWPWRTLPGEALLVSAILTHGALGLWALYRRRHLRMPAAEAWQLGLGLSIPILLLPHATAGLFADEIVGAQLTYARAMYLYWIKSPDVHLPRQLTLLTIVWLHACIGLRAWLRIMPWYRGWAPTLGALAMLLPLLALAGIVNAGWDVQRTVAADPGFAARHEAMPGTAEAAGRAALAALSARLVDIYVLLLVATLGLRQLRNWQARRTHPLRITYAGGRVVTVPRGHSVLEASRGAGIPHNALCGGRARCSTCRVRVGEGAAALPPPGPAERAVLERMKTPPNVRLACQLRPTADLTVQPLLPPCPKAAGPVSEATRDVGRELDATALFVDLRGSTALAAARLPFDALFIVARYVQAVCDAVRAHGGLVTGIAGDGVMSIFVDEAEPGRAAAQALQAAAALWRAIDAISAELAEELEAPLAFGVGIHSGITVVGLVGPAEAGTIQFIGDAGNVAARLEEMTKELGVTAVLSEQVAALGGCRLDHLERREVSVRGRAGNLVVRLVRHRQELIAALGG
jgi:adenylate cyclase